MNENQMFIPEDVLEEVLASVVRILTKDEAPRQATRRRAEALLKEQTDAS